MSYPWYIGATNALPPILDNGPQNGSLTNSPPALIGGMMDSPGSASLHLRSSSGFPTTSMYPASTVSASQHSPTSQSPHALPHVSPASFLHPLAEHPLQQHLYSATNRFGVFDGSPCAEQGFPSPFAMPSQVLSPQYSVRSPAYPAMAGYADNGQQDVSRLNPLSAYAAPGFDNYYTFDGRSISGTGQTSSTDAVFGTADRILKADTLENGIPRHAIPWTSPFGSDARGMYLQAGYGHPMLYASPLDPMFAHNSYRHMAYDGLKAEMVDPYGLAVSAIGPRYSPPDMMYSMDKKLSKKKDSSPIPKPSNVSDSPPVPNKASRYFSERGIFVYQPPASDMNSPFTSLTVADRYLMCQKVLCQRLADIDLPPKVTYVYNPLEYAFKTHYKFVKKYYNAPKRILFLGMNPGPFGMSQNGVPFGECNVVTEWMDIDGEVLKPILEHPKRPVMGMECKRSEVSGARFWELFRRLCPTAEIFFENCAIHNLCPLAFMTDTGKNVAPSDMPVKVLRQMDSLCDQTFLDVVALFKSEHVITVGKYAFTCAQKALTSHNVHSVQLHCMMHPSPANPSANKGWADIAEGQLREFGVHHIIAGNPCPTPQVTANSQQPPETSDQPMSVSQPLNSQSLMLPQNQCTHHTQQPSVHQVSGQHPSVNRLSAQHTSTKQHHLSQLSSHSLNQPLPPQPLDRVVSPHQVPNTYHPHVYDLHSPDPHIAALTSQMHPFSHHHLHQSHHYPSRYSLSPDGRLDAMHTGLTSNLLSDGKRSADVDDGDGNQKRLKHEES